VYTLEKVLKMKKDTVSGINFLDEAMKVINFNHFQITVVTRV